MQHKYLKYKVLCLLFLAHVTVQAQCAMCRAVLESEEGGAQAEAINDGIVYLMIFPYVLVGIVMYVVYRMKYPKKAKEI